MFVLSIKSYLQERERERRRERERERERGREGGREGGRERERAICRVTPVSKTQLSSTVCVK